MIDSLPPLLAGARVFVLSGAMRPSGATMEAAGAILDLLPVDRPVFVGADEGVEALFRFRLPAAHACVRVPGTILATGRRVAAGAARRVRSEEVGYAQACVQRALRACARARDALWIALPEDPHPRRAGLLPTPEGEVCFPRLGVEGAQVWGWLALALGWGLRGLVYLPGLAAAPRSWGFAYLGDGWWYAAHEVLECAHSAQSVGDPRFCDAAAHLPCLGNRTISALMRALVSGGKPLRPGLPEGEPSTLFAACRQALSDGASHHECALLLWRLWLDAHSPLLAYARTFSGFRDPFDGETFSPQDPYPRPGRRVCAAAVVAALVGDQALSAPFDAIYQHVR